MPLNRRIVINRKAVEAASEIIVEKPVEIKLPEEPPTKAFVSREHLKELEEVSVWQFSDMTGMGITMPVIYCAGCGAAPTFDADINKNTIECMNCHRVITFEQFEREQK